MAMLVCELKEQVVNVNGERITINKQDIMNTASWFATNAQKCINEAASGEVFVNDLDGYVASRKADIGNYLSGNFEPWLGFWQQAVYLKTGECVPMLN